MSTERALDNAIRVVLSGIIFPASYFDIDCLDTMLLASLHSASIDSPLITRACLSLTEKISIITSDLFGLQMYEFSLICQQDIPFYFSRPQAEDYNSHIFSTIS
jgi:hypothetical protein